MLVLAVMLKESRKSAVIQVFIIPIMHDGNFILCTMYYNISKSCFRLNVFCENSKFFTFSFSIYSDA